MQIHICILECKNRLHIDYTNDICVRIEYISEYTEYTHTYHTLRTQYTCVDNWHICLSDICQLSTHVYCVCLFWKYKHNALLLAVDMCVLHEYMNILHAHIPVMVIFPFVYEIGPREYEHNTHTLPNLFIPWNKISKYVSIRIFSARRWEDSRAYIKSGSKNTHTTRIYWQLKFVFSMCIRIFNTRDGSHGRIPAHLPNWA